MTKNIVPGYVETLDPFTVRLGGLDVEALSAERGGYAEVGMRGMVDVSGGGRLWIGEYQSDGVPTELRVEMGALTEQVSDIIEIGNGTSQALSDFEVQFTQNRTDVSVELSDIRDSVAGIVLTALTTTRLAVLSTDAGLYIDPTFSDATLSAVRATNSPGITYTGGKMVGTASMWLTGNGQDEGLSIPLIVGDRYTVRVWGTGLTAANGRQFALKDDAGYTTLTTTYTPTSMAASFVALSKNARVQLYRTTGGSASVERVELRHGIGGTLIENGSINADKISIDKAFVGLELVSPKLFTDTAPERGIKINGNTFKAYDPAGNLTIDVGGATGTIKGINLEGVNVSGTSTVTGATVQTNSGGKGRAVLRDVTDGAQLWFTSSSGGTLAEIVARSTSESYMLMRDYSATGSGQIRVDLRASMGLRLFASDGTQEGRIWGAGGQLIIDAPHGVSIGDLAGPGVVAIAAESAINIASGFDVNLRAGTGSINFSTYNSFGEWRFAKWTNENAVNALKFMDGSALMPQTDQPSNLHMHTNGVVYRSSSARKYKTAIRDADVDPELILGVTVRDWIDKAALEQDPDYSKRTPGVIAEEVVAAGLPQFVTYEQDGSVQGVMYDRLPLLLIPIVRDLLGRVTDLENSNA